MPEGTRKATALFGAFFITLFIFFVWFVGLRTQFAPDEREQASIAVSQSDEFSPISSLKRNFGELVKGLTTVGEKGGGILEHK